MPHTPQVGMFQEERQVTDPSTDLNADVVSVSGVNRLAVDGEFNDAALSTSVLANTEETAETAGVDIFASDASVPRDGIILIEYVGSGSATLSLKLIRNAVTRVADLNDGVAIGADRWQSFTFPVRSGDAINLRVDASITVTAMITFQDKT